MNPPVGRVPREFSDPQPPHQSVRQRVWRTLFLFVALLTLIFLGQRAVFATRVMGFDATVDTTSLPANSVVLPTLTSTPFPTWTTTLTPTARSTAAYAALLGTLEPPPSQWTSTPLAEVYVTKTPSPIFYASDLDGDGDEDWIFNIPAMISPFAPPNSAQNDPVRCIGHARCPWGIFILEQEAGSYQPVFALDPAIVVSRLDDPHVIAVTDLTNDGVQEVVVAATTCGSSCSHTNYIIARDADKKWYVAGAMYGVISFLDSDGDHVYDVIAKRNLACRGRYSMSEARRHVYAWQNEHYERAETIIVDSPFAYFVIKDAHNALYAGELDEALRLASGVLENPQAGFILRGECLWLSPLEEAKVVSYAGIEAMMVYALRGDEDHMLAVLKAITDKYTDDENPYVPAATIFSQAYRQTGNARFACTRMAWFLSTQNTVAWRMVPGDFYEIYVFCPLTAEQPLRQGN